MPEVIFETGNAVVHSGGMTRRRRRTPSTGDC